MGLFGKKRAVEPVKYLLLPSHGEQTFVAGVGSRQGEISGAGYGQNTFTLERDPGNEYDGNAVKVRFANVQVGFLPREVASEWAATVDAVEGTNARLVVRGEVLDGDVGLWIKLDMPSIEAVHDLVEERS